MIIARLVGRPITGRSRGRPHGNADRRIERPRVGRRPSPRCAVRGSAAGAESRSRRHNLARSDPLRQSEVFIGVAATSVERQSARVLCTRFEREMSSAALASPVLRRRKKRSPDTAALYVFGCHQLADVAIDVSCEVGPLAKRHDPDDTIVNLGDEHRTVVVASRRERHLDPTPCRTQALCRISPGGDSNGQPRAQVDDCCAVFGLVPADRHRWAINHAWSVAREHGVDQWANRQPSSL